MERNFHTHADTFAVCVLEDVNLHHITTLRPRETEGNASLYDDTGTLALLDRLAPGGVLAVWSAHRVEAYEERLRRLARDVEMLTIDVARGEPDVVYLARVPSVTA